MSYDSTVNKRQKAFRDRKEESGLKFCGGYIDEHSMKVLKDIKEGMPKGLKTSNAEAIEWAIKHSDPGFDYYEGRLRDLNRNIELLKIVIHKRLSDALREQVASGVELTVPSISNALNGIHISRDDLWRLSLIDKIQ